MGLKEVRSMSTLLGPEYDLNHSIYMKSCPKWISSWPEKTEISTNIFVIQSLFTKDQPHGRHYASGQKPFALKETADLEVREMYQIICTAGKVLRYE